VTPYAKLRTLQAQWRKSLSAAQEFEHLQHSPAWKDAAHRTNNAPSVVKHPTLRDKVGQRDESQGPGI